MLPATTMLPSKLGFLSLAIIEARLLCLSVKSRRRLLRRHKRSLIYIEDSLGGTRGASSTSKTPQEAQEEPPLHTWLEDSVKNRKSLEDSVKNQKRGIKYFFFIYFQKFARNLIENFHLFFLNLETSIKALVCCFHLKFN